MMAYRETGSESFFKQGDHRITISGRRGGEFGKRHPKQKQKARPRGQ